MLFKIYVGKTDASFTNGGLRFAIEFVKIFHISCGYLLLRKSNITNNFIPLIIANELQRIAEYTEFSRNTIGQTYS